MTAAHGSPRSASRRGFLVGTGLAVLGAVGGITAGALVHRSSEDATPPSPDVLLAAAAAEQKLIISIDTTLRNAAADPQVPVALLRVVRADHVAHLDALRASIALASGDASLAPASKAPATGTPVPPAQVLSPEQFGILEAFAARAAAGRALALTGRDAVLLASISAAEASHAELLR